MNSPIICPTVTAEVKDEFRKQLAVAQTLSTRIHLDVMDGVFTPNKSPELSGIHWSHKHLADIHLMAKNPLVEVDKYIDMSPNLIIVHAEADYITDVVYKLHSHHIRVGVAILQTTDVEVLHPYINILDHVLVFSGSLGKFGGQVDFKLLDKVSQLKQWRADLEVGWDGGISDANGLTLVKAGVDVLNVGGFLQNASIPSEAYANLVQQLEQ
jgi:pentose-5-phosphate-3-epimerase